MHSDERLIESLRLQIEDLQRQIQALRQSRTFRIGHAVLAPARWGRQMLRRTFGDRRQRLPRLEIHVCHACNLTCESCSHYSNQGHKGMLDLDDANTWMAAWSRRIRPDRLTLLGGEPSLHPRLTEIIRLARRHWPTTDLFLTSNGFFLHRHEDLPRALRETGAKLTVSLHHTSPEYQEAFATITALLKKWAELEGVNVQVWDSAGTWTRRYRGFGSSMQPYADGRPRDSWSICPARHCMQLHQGKLWKCPPIAYLGMQNDRHHLGEEWAPYLRYRPLDLSCSARELADFCRREEESICGMCPAEAEPFELPSPLISLGEIRRRAVSETNVAN